MRPTARTRLFAVIGDPVRHSLSPTIQNAAFLAAGIDATYIALAVPAADVASVLRTLVANGGGGNITIPHKRVAAAVPGLPTARVRLLGVANVFAAALDAGGPILGNTDVDGILAAIDTLGGPFGAWLIVGTGGSARAAAGAALERGVPIAVRSREPERAAAFLAWAASIGVAVAPLEHCQLVINTTPLGLQAGDASPQPLDELPSLAAALDLTYRPDGPTRWVLTCRERGLRAVDGREVLLAQGAACWEHWFPGVTPPVEVMRAALDGRLV